MEAMRITSSLARKREREQTVEKRSDVLVDSFEFGNTEGGGEEEDGEERPENGTTNGELAHFLVDHLVIGT